MPKSNMYRTLLVVWFALCSLVFVRYLNVGDKDAEHLIVFAIKMLVLTFPAGYIGNLFAAGIDTSITTLGVELSKSQNVFLQWFFMTLAGYVQWFVLLPWLWRKWKTRQT